MMNQPTPESFNAQNEGPSPKKPRDQRTTGMLLIGGVFGAMACLIAVILIITLGYINPTIARNVGGTATSQAGSTRLADLNDTAQAIITQAAMTPQNEFTATAAQNRANTNATQTAAMDRYLATDAVRTMTAQGVMAQTAQALPMTPLPEWQGNGLYERFDSNAKGWWVGHIQEDGFELERSIENGRYRWQIDAETPYFEFARFPLPFETVVQTGQILIEVHPNYEPTDTINYGIVFGLYDEGYYFSVNTAGEWHLYHRALLEDWTITDSGDGLTFTEGQPIRMGVVLENEVAYLYVNGELVHQEADIEIFSRFSDVGLGISVVEPVQTVVTFDNVSVFMP